jgi:hypothetical protein
MSAGELLQYQADTVLSLTRGGMKKGELTVMMAHSGTGKTQMFGSTVHWPQFKDITNKCRSTTELWMFKERFEQGNVTLIESDPDTHIRKYKDNAGGYFSLHYARHHGPAFLTVTGIRQWNDHEIWNYENTATFSK